VMPTMKTLSALCMVCLDHGSRPGVDQGSKPEDDLQ
jgi:hypothetical protein